MGFKFFTAKRFGKKARCVHHTGSAIQPPFSLWAALGTKCEATVSISIDELTTQVSSSI